MEPHPIPAPTPHPRPFSAISGAERGWTSTLTDLEREAGARCVAHGQFTLRRAFATTPARLFHAFAEVDAKAKWFVGPDGYRTRERTLDLRPDGRERVTGQLPNGLVAQFDAIYLDVVPDERLIHADEMRLDERKISASLATLGFAHDPKGALPTITEQGVFLDGYDDAGHRQMGTRAAGCGRALARDAAGRFPRASYPAPTLQRCLLTAP